VTSFAAPTGIGTARALVVSVDPTQLQRVSAAFPSLLYFWMRNYLGSVFGKHRQQWLRNKGIKFGRASAASRAIKVWGVNEGPEQPRDNEVVYHVKPVEVRLDQHQAEYALRKELQAVAFTGSIPLAVHEFGATIRSRGKWMAIPLTRATKGQDASGRTPRKWLQNNPGKTLVFHQAKGGSALLLAKVKQKRSGAGRPKKGEAPPPQRLERRFLLVKQVRNPPTLHMYDTWEQLSGFRGQAFAQACDRIIRQAAQGKRE
jgi:hypothetical protein